MARIDIISGGQRYADPWHPFSATSKAMAGLLATRDHHVSISDNPDKAFAGLVDDSARPELLIVNIGNPADGLPTPEAAEGIKTYTGAGHPLLAMHSSLTAFPQWDEWEEVLGGRWVRGVSMHPPKDKASIRILPSGHPAAQGMPPAFDVHDERYSYLRTEPGVHVLAEHDHDGLSHPLVWVNQQGSSEVACDALGHDEDSYSAPGRVALLLSVVDWLLRERQADRPAESEV
ncbi:ThuA domain-containing protein [Arthrobacter sp. JZ12]|uniref:ThuA domain-containing protein n=1 Tax=Arthrobacter sp. JZ12 TaxID=2654190 RepID=UPI002B45D084|nr:ThuA domain-containing protein [Arthrobacter sp. JZ12]WRH25330.1 ThuA domain-containing protein [Arthrobacter sp. JZ12]